MNGPGLPNSTRVKGPVVDARVKQPRRTLNWRAVLLLVAIGALARWWLHAPEKAQTFIANAAQQVRASFERAFAPPYKPKAADSAKIADDSSTPKDPTQPALPLATILPPRATPAYAALDHWPSTVNLETSPAVTVVSENATDAQFVYRSPHYEFVSDHRVGPDAQREFARVFEATHRLNCMLPLDFRPTPEDGGEYFRAQIYGTYEDYEAAGGMKGSGGMYSRDQQRLFVPITSLGLKLTGDRVQVDRGGEANNTLVHEITHQMMATWLPRIPTWLAEGSAEYVAMLDYMHGRFMLNEAPQQLRRHFSRFARGGKMTLMRPSQVMKLSGETWRAALGKGGQGAASNYQSALLVAFYFYHLDGDQKAGPMIEFYKAIENGSSHEDATQTHLLRSRTPDELDDEIATAFSAFNLPINFGR